MSLERKPVERRPMNRQLKDIMERIGAGIEARRQKDKEDAAAEAEKQLAITPQMKRDAVGRGLYHDKRTQDK